MDTTVRVRFSGTLFTLRTPLVRALPLRRRLAASFSAHGPRPAAPRPAGHQLSAATRERPP